MDCQLWNKGVRDDLTFQSALERGLSIIPIPPREKGTKLTDWPERAVNDAAIMEGLPDHNYGVVANDDFCILDIDNPAMFHNELGVKLPSDVHGRNVARPSPLLPPYRQITEARK